MNDQLMRDQKLIKIMEVREKEMEKNLLQKAEAFGYLYKEYQKEIRAFIKKGDEELEQSLSYRDKLWTESIDQVNSNMIKMYQAQGDFEQSLNSIRKRQNELIKQHLRTQEWYLFDTGEGGSTRKPEPSIPEYTPSNANYKYELVNNKPFKRQKRKK